MMEEDALKLIELVDSKKEILFLEMIRGNRMRYLLIICIIARRRHVDHEVLFRIPRCTQASLYGPRV